MISPEQSISDYMNSKFPGMLRDTLSMHEQSCMDRVSQKAEEIMLHNLHTKWCSEGFPERGEVLED